jgi:hypothetical protein
MMTLSTFTATNGGRDAAGKRALGLADLVAMLEFPVVVTDGRMTILMVNPKAAHILDNSGWPFEGPKVGIEIECRHVGEHGECGASPHCAGCVLRRSIGETGADGQQREGVYSDPGWRSADAATAGLFRFSTSKMGDAVVVALEEIKDSPASG